MERKTGLVHIICGDGKGKTTAAMGLVIRATGRDQKVLVAQFLKDENSGERRILNQLEQVTLVPVEHFWGFTWKMTDEEKMEAKQYYTDVFKQTVKKAADESFDMLILDEIMAAIHYEFIDLKLVLDFLQVRPEKLEVILTGRDPKASLCDMADYISEIKKVKHPLEQGIPARMGIEY